MPFTHVNPENPKTPIKRKLEFSESLRSPPALRHVPPPLERSGGGSSSSSSSSSTLRLKPNPYAADQMATIPQTQRNPSSSSTPPAGQSSEPLPSIRDMIPELPALGTQPPLKSNQDYGPESFQPTGPNLKPAATGLAPSPVISVRLNSYSTPESTHSTVPFLERQYPASAPSASRSVSRNSPTQAFSGSLAPRSEPVRALPPLSSGFGSPESGRATAYTPHPSASLPHHPPPPSHWQGQSPTYHQPSAVPQQPSSAYGQTHAHHLQSASPPYAHYDNSDYASDGKSKRRRGNLPKHVTDTLRKWFNEHTAHPYPTEDEKMMLMNATNLTMSQISNWFINARRRSVPQQLARDAGPDVRDGVPIGYTPERGA